MCGCVGLSIEHGQSTQRQISEENWYSQCSHHNSSSAREWGFVVPSLIHVGILTGFILCRRMQPQPPWLHVYNGSLSWPEDIFFAAILPTSGSAHISICSSMMVPEPWWRKHQIDVSHIKRTQRRVLLEPLTFCSSTHCVWVSVLNSIYCRNKLRWGLKTAQPEGAGKGDPGSQCLIIYMRILYNAFWS